MAFTNSFFSIAGQKERLTNVVSVLGAALNPFDKTKVEANISNPLLKSATEFVANNPYTTAAIVAAPIASGTRGAIASTISKAPTVVKVGSVAAGLVAVPAIVSSPKAASKVVDVVGTVTPEKLVNLGAGAGSLLETPSVSSAKEFVKENAATLGTLTAASALIALPTAIKTVSSISQTQSAKKAAQATEDYAEEARKQTKILDEQLAKNSIPPTVTGVTSPPPVTPSPKELPSTPLPEGSPNNPITSPTVGEEPKKGMVSATDQLKKRLKYRKAYKVEEYYKKK